MQYETLECPCCGAEIDEWSGSTAACPVCGWVIDELAAPEESSRLNDGLSLEEAVMNFHVFGSIHLPSDELDEEK